MLSTQRDETVDTRLGWAAIDRAGGGRAPVVLAAPRGRSRGLALSRLAAEVVARRGRVLWVGCGRNERPLAWLQLSERTLDAVDLQAWPLPDPTRLDPSHFALWLAYATGCEQRSVGLAVAREAGRRAGDARGYDAVLEDVKGAVDRASLAGTSGLRWQGGAHDVAGAGDARPLAGCDLLTVAGTARDLVRAADAIALLLAGALTAHERTGGGAELLIVLDGFWDAASPPLRRLLRALLAQHATVPAGRALLAAEDPAAWEGDPSGLALLERATAVVSAEFAGRLPMAWPVLPATTAMGVLDPVFAVQAAPRGWRWLRCPTDITEGLPGACVIDVGEEAGS